MMESKPTMRALAASALAVSLLGCVTPAPPEPDGRAPTISIQALDADRQPFLRSDDSRVADPFNCVKTGFPTKLFLLVRDADGVAQVRVRISLGGVLLDETVTTIDAPDVRFTIGPYEIPGSGTTISREVGGATLSFFLEPFPNGDIRDGLAATFEIDQSTSVGGEGRPLDVSIVALAQNALDDPSGVARLQTFQLVPPTTPLQCRNG